MKGKKGIILGVANQMSIAYGCLEKINEVGADIALTYGHEKTKAYVQPIVDEFNIKHFYQYDVQKPEQFQKVLEKITADWGKIDFVIHSIAFADRNDLHGRVVDSSSAGFAKAMTISCHSFAQIAKMVEPYMQEGGSLVAMSFYGSQKYIDDYSIMGPIKAALESLVRYMAVELGQSKIRVNAISPGLIPTRAASGLKDFASLFDTWTKKMPLSHELCSQDVGSLARFLVSDEAKAITGCVIPVDCGYHIIG